VSYPFLYFNQSRLKALRAREDALQVIFTEAKSQLTTLSSKTDKYKKLLHRAIIEALIKIDEPEVSIQVRKEDLNIINEVLTNVKQDYTKKTGKSVNLTIDQTNFLPPATGEGATCAGGVLLVGANGHIRCNNTLDTRLEMAFDGLMPDIRKLLYGDVQHQQH